MRQVWVEFGGMGMKNRTVPVDTVLPHVMYRNLAEAMAWLERVFGFREHYRYGDGPMGAQMLVEKAVLQMRQARGEERTPKELGFGTQSLTVFVEDVDGHYARAKAGGAKIVEEPHETEYGEYQYGAEDLDGHHWLFARHARDMAPEDWGGASTSGRHNGLRSGQAVRARSARPLNTASLRAGSETIRA